MSRDGLEEALARKTFRPYDVPHRRAFMSTFLATKEDSYRQQRAASSGAGITLVCGAGEFVASFDCAQRCAAVLGNRDLRDAGDGIFEVIPIYKIPVEAINLALAKLTARYSVALVDLSCEKTTSRFVLVWKINPTNAVHSADADTLKPITVDDL